MFSYDKVIEGGWSADAKMWSYSKVRDTNTVILNEDGSFEKGDSENPPQELMEMIFGQ